MRDSKFIIGLRIVSHVPTAFEEFASVRTVYMDSRGRSGSRQGAATFPTGSAAEEALLHVWRMLQPLRLTQVVLFIEPVSALRSATS